MNASKSGESNSRNTIAVKKLIEVGSRRTVAARMGMSVGTIINVINGATRPTMRVKEAAYKCYGIPISDWEVPIDRTPANTTKPVASTTLQAPPKELDFASDPQGAIAQLESYVNDTMSELASSNAMPEDKAKTMQRLANTISTIKKLKGESVAEVVVANHPKWIALRDAIFVALDKHPAARADVLEQIRATLEYDPKARKQHSSA